MNSTRFVCEDTMLSVVGLEISVYIMEMTVTYSTSTNAQNNGSPRRIREVKFQRKQPLCMDRGLLIVI